MYMEMKYRLAGCLTVILNQVKTGTAERFLHCCSKLCPERKYFCGNLRIQFGNILKMFFRKDQGMTF